MSLADRLGNAQRDPWMDMQPRGNANGSYAYPVDEPVMEQPALFPDQPQGLWEHLAQSFGHNPLYASANLSRPGGGLGAVAALASLFVNSKANAAGQDLEGRRALNERASEAARTLNEHRWAAALESRKQWNANLVDISKEERRNPQRSIPAKLAAAMKKQGATVPSSASTMETDRLMGIYLPKPSGVGGGGLFGGTPGTDDVLAIADAIERGDQPPLTTGLYKYAGPVRGELGRRKFNQAKALSDWNATQKEIGTLNGRQQLQIRQTAMTLLPALDAIDELSQHLAEISPSTNSVPLNKLVRYTARDWGVGGEDAMNTASQLRQQIADVVPELANIYMAGGVPSDKALALAGQNLSDSWGPSRLRGGTVLVRRNVNYRLHAMEKAQPMVPGGSAMPSATPSVSGAVHMKGSDGVVRDVPAEKVQEAEAHGMVRVP